MLSSIFAIVPVTSLLALTFAFIFFRQMMKSSEGTEKMQRIAEHVRKGASAYLRQQYKIVIIVFIVITIIFSFLAYGLGVQNKWVPFAFITGGAFSGLAGFFGMKAATYASARVANACRTSLNMGLKLAFRSGAVMGLVVVGLVLMDISIWFLVLNHFIEDMAGGYKLMTITAIMLTFGMGASTQALFARVGGGIYTKAADVGADLVGKVEAGIPEDDPRNPATIADNVGDNVGDVAGMGADLFESFAASILATALLGAAAFIHMEDIQLNAVLAPMLIAAVGTLLSIAGVFMVSTREGATQKELLKALGLGVNVSALLIIIASFFILQYLALPNYVGIWGAIVVGLLAGIGIGQSTEYYTASAYRPTQKIAESGNTGPATVIISGVGTGLISASIPLIIIVVAITLAFGFATGFNFGMDSLNVGLYGIGIAAVGMLSTLGITLATDAYGPIADNAGGNAEMSGLGAEVRQRTDALDSLGNTTAATGKGFAIGSAALTALALLASYFEEVRMMFVKILDRPQELINNVPAIDASFYDFVQHYEIHLMNPKVIVGMFLGVMAVFVFSGITMNAVGRAAQKMVDEVRRQFRTIPGIMEGTAEPDYARCVEISTKGAQREMMTPSLIALLIPVVVGLVFGVPGIAGLLTGTITSGFALAIFMANAGGAWDNAKKYVEEGNLGGKGSETHKATVIGDTVGDPFKDTSGPSLNILIKLMVMASVVTVGVAVSYHLL
ncbi:sodium-translocating pyrophosphatase [Geofilum rubicundum]|uniref:Putative K(+)-stimulated pyrophosphate-energized sodium pump n=1 Tax=Geofilum rubicundum JCM 15548 TaxID=1236989 RepID=A0A0E9LV38_9BACT|nr:sodium-translocating pyrophosphatase [Geofilum rubicundum]GAO28981.1 pyrophosphate-energized proton pump [Geofilum rubicundum JCM 15548]